MAIRCPAPASALAPGSRRLDPRALRPVGRRLPRLAEIPLAWASSGWRLWQYASDEYAGRPAYGQTSIVQGVSRCDRNLFNGDATALHRFWSAAD